MYFEEVNINVQIYMVMLYVCDIYVVYVYNWKNFQMRIDNSV